MIKKQHKEFVKKYLELMRVADEKIKIIQDEFFERDKKVMGYDAGASFEILEVSVLTNEIHKFYACSANYKPFSQLHVPLWIDGILYQKKLDMIYQVKYIFLNNVEESPIYYSYHYLDKQCLNFYYTPLTQSSVVLRNVKETISKEVTSKMNDKEHNFVKAILEFQNCFGFDGIDWLSSDEIIEEIGEKEINSFSDVKEIHKWKKRREREIKDVITDELPF